MTIDNLMKLTRLGGQAPTLAPMNKGGKFPKPQPKF